MTRDLTCWSQRELIEEIERLESEKNPATTCALCDKPMDRRADGGNAHPACAADIPL